MSLGDRAAWVQDMKVGYEETSGEPARAKESGPARER